MNSGSTEAGCQKRNLNIRVEESGSMWNHDENRRGPNGDFSLKRRLKEKKPLARRKHNFLALAE